MIRNHRNTNRHHHPSTCSRAQKAGGPRFLRNNKLEQYPLRTLQAAAETWDRKEQARGALAQQGPTFTDDRNMIRARLEVAPERDSCIAFLHALRELGLDVEPPKPRRIGEIGVVTWEDLQR
jgi:hypothetical protein